MYDFLSQMNPVIMVTSGYFTEQQQQRWWSKGYVSTHLSPEKYWDVLATELQRLRLLSKGVYQWVADQALAVKSRVQLKVLTMRQWRQVI